MSTDRSTSLRPTHHNVYRHKNGTIEMHPDHMKCLEDGVYLNDEIVQFFTAYLMSDVCHSDIAPDIHIFDSIFYVILKETFTKEKIDPAKWAQLKKWLNGVDIFDKSFLIFPCCHEDHWFAVVVCHPSSVAYFDEESPSPDQSSDTRGSQRPGIIVLDSLRLNNYKVTSEIREFLDLEWRTKMTKVKNFSYHNLAQYHPVLPKQGNAYDCGIFMLAYIKSFILQPEKFYRHARRAEKSDMLWTGVHSCLSECSREALKALIRKLCKIRE